MKTTDYPSIETLNLFAKKAYYFKNDAEEKSYFKNMFQESLNLTIVGQENISL